MRSFFLLLLLGPTLPIFANPVFKPFKTNTLPPGIDCPPNTTIHTDTLACTAAFSYTVLAFDDEPGWVLTQTAGLPSGTDFPLGETLNTFQVSNNGDTVACSFTVTVTDRIPGYFIRFPDDHYQVPCDSAGHYGEPVLFGADCEQVIASFEDQIPAIIVDACYQLERDWTVVNWSTYNPGLPLVQVPNPKPEPSFKQPANLAGPVVSAPGTTGAWASTIKKLHPNAPVATDFSAFFNTDANGYLYKQIIWVVDFEAPVIVDCPASPLFFADTTQNDDLLWNAVFDPALPARDLREAPLDLSITVTDACSGPNVAVNYHLFLDLDADGVQETVVRPFWSPNTIYYNNAGSASYTDGTPIAFDLRPVPANQKYSFSLESISDGKNRISTLRWGAGQWGGAPYVPVQLPAGIHRIKWFVQDGCGNETTCEYSFVVKNGPLTIHCPPDATVGADSTACSAAFSYSVIQSDDTPALVLAQTAGFPSGSTFPAGETGNAFQLTSAGDTASCSFTVTVVDGLPPAVNCTALADVTVACENFDPTLLAYGGEPGFSDNCCLESNTSAVSYALFDTVCNRGTITRTFLAFDCGGNSSGCTQQIVVDRAQGFFVHFPDDVYSTVCDGTGFYGEPVFLSEICEHATVTYEDETIDPVPDACIRIERRWTIVDGCRYDPALPLANVPNPTPNAIANHASNLPGPVVSAPGTPAPWASTLVKINPTDPAATDYSSFYAPEANGYVYVQRIRIIDMQQPVVSDCPAASLLFADSSQNDAQLWNNGFNPDLPIQNLSETPVDLHITASDSCTGAHIILRYLLFLDLDADGVQETVVNSANLPPAGKVFVGNAGNPSFSGGMLFNFDQRPVVPDKKYRFALQTSIDGLNGSFAVRWNTAELPGTYEVPQLPFGTHKIKWILEDNCGNATICEYNFFVEGGIILPANEAGAMRESGFALYQNVPNPFRGGTSIGFNLPEPATAILSVFDAQGRLLFRHAATYGPGRNSIDLNDSALDAGGILYYKLETERHSAWRKMALIR